MEEGGGERGGGREGGRESERCVEYCSVSFHVMGEVWAQNL